MEGLCDKCGKEVKDIPRCSKECQKTAWPNHKLTCNPDQKLDGIETNKIKDILCRYEVYVKVMSGICGTLWNGEELLCCHVLRQTGIQHWTYVIESYPSVNTEGTPPKDCYNFAVSCSTESPLKYRNQSCIAVPKETCYEGMKIFNGKIPVLPILLLITPNEILVVDRGSF
jgi:hypothetical protein